MGKPRRVATVLLEYLKQAGHSRVFMIVGGGHMHMDDALLDVPELKAVCFHHEQAAAMAAEGYARIAGKAGIVSVTSGPGGINAIAGVFGAWTDSVPMVVLAGQAKRETCMAFHPVPGLRQLGDQEIDSVALAAPITKYAARVDSPERALFELQKCLHLAESGRPGPTWLEIPLDIQGALVDPGSMERFVPDTEPQANLSPYCFDTLQAIQKAERPVLLAGSGVRISGAHDAFLDVAERLGVPVVTAWTPDTFPSDHPLFCGRQGTIGTRGGNFTVQNADLVLILGSRMCIRQISYDWNKFAPNALRIQVDIDPAEMFKSTGRGDICIKADVRAFLEEMLTQIKNAPHVPHQNHQPWLEWCRERSRRYPVVLDSMRHDKDGINPYWFVEELFKRLDGDDIVACANSTCCIVPFQAGTIKPGMRMFSNSGSASMGHGLPAAIGAAEAGNGKRVICLEGDGSMMMNCQELTTLAYRKLPVKVFVFDNNGYMSIRMTQQAFFGRIIGESPESGVGFPDFAALGKAHGLETVAIRGNNWRDSLREYLDSPGPSLAVVALDPNQPFEPKLSSRKLPDGRMVSSPLEDMYPFLDRAEFAENMNPPGLHA